MEIKSQDYLKSITNTVNMLINEHKIIMNNNDKNFIINNILASVIEYSSKGYPVDARIIHSMCKKNLL